jgi:hypothetical protein
MSTPEELVEYFRKPNRGWLCLTRGDIKALRWKLTLWENLRLKVGKFPVCDARALKAGWTYETIRAQVWLPDFTWPWSKK